MPKTILITGSTDGIGLETAKMLTARGHSVLLHGRSAHKLQAAAEAMSANATLETYQADLSSMDDVTGLAAGVSAKHQSLDVLINNAGVYKLPDPVTAQGLDARFVVNTIAPWLLTRQLLPLLGSAGRVVNLSSAAQSPVNPEALAGQARLSDGVAYAQSKLALTMWSRFLALSLGETGPAIIAVNPGSMLGSKMVKEAYGVAGGDIRVGADILTRAALSDEFADATGLYFDNDAGRFASPHPDALDHRKCAQLVEAIQALLQKHYSI